MTVKPLLLPNLHAVLRQSEESSGDFLNPTRFRVIREEKYDYAHIARNEIQATELAGREIGDFPNNNLHA